MNDIVMYEVQLTVRVRKYDVDIESLKDLLHSAKKKSRYTNKQLCEILDIPLTQVEHYFRRDIYFAIPEPSIWYRLKEVLGITDNRFDESIMTFIEKPGVYEKANRIYGANGIAPTLLCGDEVKIISQ